MSPEFPSDWVDAIFARLTLAYGSRFRDQWDGQEPDHVKAYWRTELRGITSGGVAHALAHLDPSYPPNALQFRALCVRAPVVARFPALPGVAPSEDNLRRVAAAAEVLRGPRDPKAWARALKAREEAGEHLSSTQRSAWRAVL
jgi:hypothetical protein